MANKNQSSQSVVDAQHPLYLHPSDGPQTLNVIKKLAGASNYRAWRRNMEISHAAKRKLGFVTGLKKIDKEDPEKQDQWDTCNNMVIAWLTASMTPTIRESVMYVRSAKDIWDQLERRFSIASETRKYRLNKAVYDYRQKEKTVSECYTAMIAMWDELESLNHLPRITFLNKRNDDYGSERSQLLLTTPLPTVENACARILQVEAQREVLGQIKAEPEGSATFSKGMEEGCGACGKKGHTKDKYWTVIGYPKWHPKARKQAKGKEKEGGSSWKGLKYKAQQNSKYAGNAQMNENVNVTAQQLEQILKLIPSNTNSEAEEEIDSGFTGMVSCCNASLESHKWILDSGASDHTTGDPSIVNNVRNADCKLKIKLPTGKTTSITHMGEFRHNLLSVARLVKDENCQVMFYPKCCLIQDSLTQKIKAVGVARKGLYYLEDIQVDAVLRKLKEKFLESEIDTPSEDQLLGEGEQNINSDSLQAKNVEQRTQEVWVGQGETDTAPVKRSTRVSKLPTWLEDYAHNIKKAQDKEPAAATS
ncbi:Retrovirus-related Pol polyprotein from transposon RE1, partial [Bienertia sinuspersici]